MKMPKKVKIYVSGHTGLVGGALIRQLEAQGYTNILTATRHEVNLLDHHSVEDFFQREKPEYVFHLAAKVGGIKGNSTYPADFIHENLRMQNNVIHSSHRIGVKKLLFLGSVCIYPKHAPTPIKEEYLLTGPLEQTNEAYAIAKIAGLMMCKKHKEQYGDNFISVMPANLYGINDNFHPVNSHVIPALIRRFVEAKKENKPNVVIWGTGKATRDFMFADDLADGLIHAMHHYDEVEHINIGPGEETSIMELVQVIKDAVGYEGELEFDTTKPDGTPKRYLDTTKISALGWKPKHTLKEGIEKTVAWYLQQIEEGNPVREL
jgi:GDP-L-fucose synthase